MAANYNPYSSNLYLQDLQSMRDRIDNTMKQYQQTQQNQYIQPQQPQIQQTFQLAPNQPTNNLDAKFVSGEDDVTNYLVIKPTIFATQDYSSIWVKDINGKVRFFKTEEIIKTDGNTQEINDLKKELAEVKALLAQQKQQSQIQEQPQVQTINNQNQFTKENKNKK